MPTPDTTTETTDYACNGCAADLSGQFDEFLRAKAAEGERVMDREDLYSGAVDVVLSAAAAGAIVLATREMPGGMPTWAYLAVGFLACVAGGGLSRLAWPLGRLIRRTFRRLSRKETRK
ncbi:hypothetical protein ABZ639_17020 [Saccharomonospora sp. NPDC006951]